MTASLRIRSSKAESNTWESFTRSELKLESVHQESPCSDIFRKRATKPLLKHRQKHLTWATEKKTWTFAQWSKVLFSDKSKFCCNVCWCWFIVFYQVQSQFSRLPGDLSTLCLHLLTSFMEMLISFSSRTLVPKALPSGLLTLILLGLIGQTTCLTWTPSGIYGIFSRERWETVDPTVQTSWRLCHRLLH